MLLEDTEKANLIKKLNEAYEEIEELKNVLSFYKINDKIISEKCDDLYFTSITPINDIY